MKTGVIVLVVVAVVALLFGGTYVSSRNQMVTKNEAVKSAWAQVDVVLQRRADLIPNLVETVKGFAAQEQTVFHDIASARAALLGAQTPADKIAANGQLDGAIGRLLLIVENYPQLKSNENFLRLQDELAGTENRIAAGLQHVPRALPEQYICGLGRIPAQQRLLHGIGIVTRSAKSPIPDAEPVTRTGFSPSGFDFDQLEKQTS
jgi:LemA protein